MLLRHPLPTLTRGPQGLARQVGGASGPFLGRSAPFPCRLCPLRLLFVYLSPGSPLRFGFACFRPRVLLGVCARPGSPSGVRLAFAGPESRFQLRPCCSRIYARNRLRPVFTRPKPRPDLTSLEALGPPRSRPAHPGNLTESRNPPPADPIPIHPAPLHPHHDVLRNDTRSASSRSVSSVRDDSPEPRIASANARLDSSMSAMRSSTVPSVMRRWTCTGWVWPMR